MNTSTYNGSIGNLWSYLQGLSLSASDSQWLAERLTQNAKKQEETKDPEKTENKPVFTHIDDSFKPSERVLSRILGPLPADFDIDKELELMWEERAR